MEPLMPFKYVIISPEDTSMDFSSARKDRRKSCREVDHIRLTKGIFSYILQPTFYRYAKEAQTWKES